MHVISISESASPKVQPATDKHTQTQTPDASALLPYFQAVVADDAEEGDDGVQHGQDAQRGLHVAAALLQDVVHGQDAGRVAVQAADAGALTGASRGELLPFDPRRSGHLIQSIGSAVSSFL